MRKRLILPLVALLTALLYVLLHSDSSLKLGVLALYITSLWLAVTWMPRLYVTPLARGLRRLFLTNLVVMIFVTALFSVSSSIFAYYQWGWLFFALASFVLVAATRAIYGRIDPTAVPPQYWKNSYWLLIGFSLITLVGALFLLPPHYSIVDLLLVFWALGALPLVAAALIGSVANISICFPKAALVATCILVILAGSLLSLSSIHNFPNFTWTDEPWLINYVDTYQRTGNIDATMFPSSPGVVMGHIWQFAANAWMSLMSGDLFALRVFSTIGGFALLSVVFALTRTLQNTRTAWVATALLSVNLAWLAVAHIGRQEMWLTVAIWLSLWLSVLARRSFWFAVAAGLVITLGVEIHTLGVLACIALGIWWLFQWWKGAYSLKMLTAFIGGALLGTSLYLINHVLPNSASFFAAITDQMVSSGADGFDPLARIIPRHANYFESNPVEFSLLIVSCVWAFRHGGAARSIGIFTLLLFALYALLVSDVNPYYVMAWIPGLVIMLAIMVNNVVERWRAPLAVIIAGAALLNVLLVRHQVVDNWNERALETLGEVVSYIPNRGTMLANSLFYMPIRHPDFISTTYMYAQSAKSGESPWAIVRQIAPEWIIDGERSHAYAPEFLIFSIETNNASLGLEETDLTTEYQLFRVVDTELGQFKIWRRVEAQH